MKEFEKWLKEKLEKHIIPTSSYTWRAAFELMLKWLEIEEPFEDFYRRIEDELNDR